MIAPGIDDLPGQIDELNLNVSIIWSSVPLLFVTLIVVGLRLWARKIKGLSFGLDDWLIIICVVCQTRININQKEEKRELLTDNLVSSPYLSLSSSVVRYPSALLHSS